MVRISTPSSASGASLSATRRLRLGAAVSFCFAALLGALLASHVPAQGSTAAAEQEPQPAESPAAPTAPAARALSLTELVQDFGLFYGSRPTIHWIGDSGQLAVMVPYQDSAALMPLTSQGALQPLPWSVVQAAMAAIPGMAERAGQLSPQVLDGATWVDGDTLRLEIPGAVIHYSRSQNTARRALTTLPDAAREAIFRSDDPATSDSRGAFVCDHDLWVVSARDGIDQVTTDGAEDDIVYGDAAHRAEFGISDGLWWSPDGGALAFFREDRTFNPAYPYQDPTAVPPVAVHGRYPMAGGPHATASVGVYVVATQELVYLQREPTEYLPEEDIYWTNVTWSPDGTRLYVALVSRDQERMELVRFDAATGKQEAVLFTESDPEWIEPEDGPEWLPDGSGRFLWHSNRDGFIRLWLHEQDGTLVRPVTPAGRDMGKLMGYSADQSRVIFSMSPETSPIEWHLWSAPLGGASYDPKQVVQLTARDGWNEGELSPDSRWLRLDWWDSDDPGDVQIAQLSEDGASIARGPSRVLEMPNPWTRYAEPGEMFFTVQANDLTTLHGHVFLPPGYDPEAEDREPLPTLLYVYGGPHSQLVRHEYNAGASPFLKWLATCGYAVMRLDNRGTDNRGIDFAQAIHRRCGELEVQDQLRGLDHLVELGITNPDRVAVHGWSYGGYMTLRLMLKAPDRFACGISGAPVTQWEMYETGYTERYMDTPQENPDGYAMSSVIPIVGNLQGKLMLVHGSGDKTVMWSHTLSFLDACIDAGVDLDYFVYPNQLHALRGRDRVHFYKKVARYLGEHLGGSCLITPLPEPSGGGR